jgi:TonB family protein
MRAVRVVSCCVLLLLSGGYWLAFGAQEAQAPTSQSDGPTGTWRVEDVAYAPWTLVLHADGTTLTGTVIQAQTNRAGGQIGITTLTAPVAIYDGTIDGNTISFKCKSPDGNRTITFAGQMSGDEITFSRDVQVRPGGDPGEDGIYGAAGASHFTAKRISIGTLVPAIGLAGPPTGMAHFPNNTSHPNFPLHPNFALQPPPEQIELPDNDMMRHLARTTVMPIYPEEDQKRGISGPAVIEFVVGLDGRVTQPQIVVAPDQAIGQAALDAASQWTFQHPPGVQIRGDLTFYFVLDNGAARVLNPVELPSGTTFSSFPHSLRMKQILEIQQQRQEEALRLERRDTRLLPPSSFPELPAAFRADLERRGCMIPQRPEVREPNNVVRGEFARKHQIDWAALCAKGDETAIIVYWGKPTACSAEVGSSSAAEGEYFSGDGQGNAAFLRSIGQVGRRQIVESLRPTEAGGSKWVTKPPEYPALDHLGIVDDGFLRGYVSYVHYCSHGHWFKLESDAE